MKINKATPVFPVVVEEGDYNKTVVFLDMVNKKSFNYNGEILSDSCTKQLLEVLKIPDIKIPSVPNHIKKDTENLIKKEVYYGN